MSLSQSNKKRLTDIPHIGESACPCLHVSVWGCRPTHARTGRVVHDHLRMRWRIGLHGHVVRDEGTRGKPRLAKQGRCDGVAPYCRIYQQFACCLAVQLGVRVSCRLRSNVHRLSYLPLVRYARGIYEGLAMKAGLSQTLARYGLPTR